MTPVDFAGLRDRMVSEQIEARGIHDPALLDAFRHVPRHEFVPSERKGEAYEDRPLSIGSDQTISQPYMVATMTDALHLRAGEKILEVGTGSGYQTAILVRMGVEVFTIERISSLSDLARIRLDGLECREIHYRIGDGSLGWPEEAPFDGIIVTAAMPSLPVALTSQLVEDRGRMVVPVGETSGEQELLLVRRHRGRVTTESICRCVFVPMIGAEGW